MNNQQNSNAYNILELPAIDFQLLRIIVIDSYCEGRKVELQLDGHVALNGANGAGKTTMLRLIPIFFGERPQRVITGAKTFGEYYFPHSTSYVVYEYKRRDAKVLAVIHADGQSDNVVYRFIDHEYDNELFRNERGFVQSQDLHKHLDGKNISFTKPFSRVHYEQILTNSATTHEHKSLAARYAFVGAGSRLTHINRVISGILNRVTEFSDLKRMVASTIYGDDKQFTLSTKKNELRKWIRELQAHQSLEEKRPRMVILEEADTNRVRLLNEMGTLHSRLKTLLLNLECKKELTAKLFENKKSERTILEQQFNQSNHMAEQEKARLEAIFQQTLKDITAIEERFKEYKKDEIDQSCTLVDSLPDIQRNYDGLVRTIEELSGEIKNVDDKFQRLIGEEKLNLQLQKNSELENRNKTKEKFRMEIDSVAKNHDAILSQIKAASELTSIDLRGKESLANDKVVSLQTEQKYVTGDASIQASLKQERATLESVTESLNLAFKDVTESNRNYTSILSRYKDQESLCNDVSMVLESAKIEYDRFHALSSAGKDTFIGFLREERPEWVGDIGRIINEDILLRKDLNPELTGGSSLYGININLDQIEDSKLSTEEKIQQELARARSRINNAQDACDEEDKILLKIEESRKELAEKKLLSEANFNKLESASKETQSKIDLLNAKLEHSKKAAIENIRIALAAAEVELSDIRANLTIEEQKLNNEIAFKNKEKTQLINAINANENAALKLIDDRENVLQVNYEAKIAEFNANRIEMLTGKGVNPELLKKLEADKLAVDKNIELAKKQSQVVDTYRSWLDNTYSGLSKMHLDASQQKINLDTAKSAQAALKKEYDNQENLISNEILAVQKQLSDEEQSIRHTSVQLESIINWPTNLHVETMPHDEAFSLVDLINEKNRINTEDKRYKKIIADGVDEIRQEMLRVPGTETEQYCLANEKESGRPILNQEYEWLKVCRSWFNQGYKSRQDSIINDCRSQGINIKTFCDSLEDMETKVTTFNREIRNSLSLAKMFATINNVDISITTDIRKQDYWYAINELKLQYEMWQPTAAHSMPPQSFVDAANDVANIVYDDRGLVANPTDLINIRIDAVINNKPVSAKNEKELKELSSTGLSYLVMAIVMVGFVNRIRGKNNVVIPYAIDEVGDLDPMNTVSLLEFLAQNNIMIVGAFPKMDEYLAPKFRYMFTVLEDQRIAIVDIDGAKATAKEVMENV